METKVYAVAFIWYWTEIMDEKPKDSKTGYIINNILRFGKHGGSALDVYSNTRCPASQFLEANSEKELDNKIEELKKNIDNPDWIEKLEECL